MIVANKGNAIKLVKGCFSLLELSLGKLFLESCSMTVSFCGQVVQILKLHDKLAQKKSFQNGVLSFRVLVIPVSPPQT